MALIAINMTKAEEDTSREEAVESSPLTQSKRTASSSRKIIHCNNKPFAAAKNSLTSLILKY